MAIAEIAVADESFPAGGREKTGSHVESVGMTLKKHTRNDRRASLINHFRRIMRTVPGTVRFVGETASFRVIITAVASRARSRNGSTTKTKKKSPSFRVVF